MYAFKTCKFIRLNMVNDFLFSLSGFSVTFVRKFMNVSIFELVSSIRYKLTCVYSEDSNLNHSEFALGPGRTCNPWICSLTVDPGAASSIPARSHTFLEIYHEIISTVILLLPLIQEGLLSVTSDTMCMKYWLTTLSSLPRKMWLGELTLLSWP